jgi:hypothetical protein
MSAVLVVRRDLVAEVSICFTGDALEDVDGSPVAEVPKVAGGAPNGGIAGGRDSWAGGVAGTAYKTSPGFVCDETEGTSLRIRLFSGDRELDWNGVRVCSVELLGNDCELWDCEDAGKSVLVFSVTKFSSGVIRAEVESDESSRAKCGSRTWASSSWEPAAALLP